MPTVEKLLKMLDSPKASVRCEACEELRGTPSLTDDAFVALEKATVDRHLEVRQAAQRALALHKSQLTSPFWRFLGVSALAFLSGEITWGPLYNIVVCPTDQTCQLSYVANDSEFMTLALVALLCSVPVLIVWSVVLSFTLSRPWDPEPRPRLRLGFIIAGFILGLIPGLLVWQLWDLESRPRPRLKQVFTIVSFILSFIAGIAIHFLLVVAGSF